MLLAGCPSGCDRMFYAEKYGEDKMVAFIQGSL